MNQASPAHFDSSDTQDRGHQWQVQCGSAQPHWIGPSWYLSQAGSVSSLSQGCWLWTKESMSQSYMAALLWDVYISEGLRSSFPPSLYLVAVRTDETNKCRKIKRQGESIKCIPGPALALIFSVSPPNSSLNYSMPNDTRESGVILWVRHTGPECKGQSLQSLKKIS